MSGTNILAYSSWRANFLWSGKSFQSCEVPTQSQVMHSRHRFSHLSKSGCYYRPSIQVCCCKIVAFFCLYCCGEALFSVTEDYHISLLPLTQMTSQHTWNQPSCLQPWSHLLEMTFRCSTSCLTLQYFSSGWASQVAAFCHPSIIAEGW